MNLLSKVHLRQDLKLRVEVLCGQPLESKESLLQEVKRHARIVEIVAKSRPLQLNLAHALVKGLNQLLESQTDSTPPEHVQLIQAAAKYFVENADSDHDLASDTGLDDDGEVFVAIARAVDRTDLVGEISRLLRRE